MKLSRAVSCTALGVIVVYAAAVLLGAPLLRQLSHKCSLARHLSLGGIFGAWFGAFVIPFDWDRWWQRWPVPCVFGAVIGGILGCMTSSYKILFSYLGRQGKLEKFV
uniref:Glycosylphosphatidylinositol anchor biosynthesis protein 11 n=1 Tax=Loa loa TaxID=7209 RepID=A0A1I7VG89_LOALO